MQDFVTYRFAILPKKKKKKKKKKALVFIASPETCYYKKCNLNVLGLYLYQLYLTPFPVKRYDSNSLLF